MIGRLAGLPVLLAGLILAAVPVRAADLGVLGATWPVAEPDLLEAIRAHLEEKMAQGGFEDAARDAAARTRAFAEAPPAVEGIGAAQAFESRLIDPRIIVEEDIKDHEGRVIVRKGARVNPLERRPLTRKLLFIDGGSDVQVSWALAQEGPAKVILIAGRPLELARHHGQVFFFDQQGLLVRRFGITATPAEIVQDGVMLRLTQFPLGQGGGG